jgi:hypothetical protein
MFTDCTASCMRIAAVDMDRTTSKCAPRLLFANGAVCSYVIAASNDWIRRVNNELLRIWKEMVAGTSLEGLRKTVHNFGKCSRPRTAPIGHKRLVITRSCGLCKM